MVPSEANSLDNNFQLSPSAVRLRASNEGRRVQQCLQYCNDKSSQIVLNMKSMFQSSHVNAGMCRYAERMQQYFVKVSSPKSSQVFLMQEQITAAQRSGLDS